MGIEVLLGILASLGAGASVEILRNLYEKLVEQREKLPAKIESAEDIQKVKLVLEEKAKQIGEVATENVTVGVIESTYSHLEGIRTERLRQARATFNTALVLVVVGVLIIFAGVVLMYIGQTTAGIVSSAVGVVTEIISAVLFRLNKETNDRLDALAPDLTILERARYGMKFIEHIEDKDARNKAIEELTKDIRSKPKQVLPNKALQPDRPAAGG